MFGKSKNNTRRIRLPFESTDEKPYIFVSYGHDDKEKVFPLLKTLYESGFNVWYDEGITIGEKYDEVIESHIRGPVRVGRGAENRGGDQRNHAPAYAFFGEGHSYSGKGTSTHSLHGA